MEIISVNNLCKQYGAFTAVDDISFTVEEGTIFGLLGSNGAGKTTTLEILETLKIKDSGKVIIDTKDLDNLNAIDELKSIIGVQLQTSGYYPHLNLKDILELFAGLYQVTINPLAILESIGLQKHAKHTYKQLSGGQKQKFSIATTIINNPKIIFLDEPTTGLDPLARRQLWQQILDLKQGGATIVITTHYMEEAETLCDNIAIMDRGKILKIGTPTALIEELLANGFKPEKQILAANLEDVFIAVTGKNINDTH